MNIDDFRYIKTIAETGSLTNAAKELFVSQPSLSQRVKYIEDTYGIIIFIRDPKKGILLTEEGECFLRYANQILGSEEDLRKEISDMHDLNNNTLRIGTSQLISSPLFDRLLLHFYECQPHIHCEFIEQSSPQIQQLLSEGKIDIALSYLPVIYPNLKYEVIYSDRFVLIPAKGSVLEEKIQGLKVSPASEISVSLLENEPLATGTPETRLHQYTMSVLERNNCRPNIQHYCKNFSMLYSIAKAGIASAILYKSFFDPSKENLPYYYLADTNLTELSIAVVWRKNTYLRQTARDLIKIAHEVMGTEELSG